MLSLSAAQRRTWVRLTLIFVLWRGSLALFAFFGLHYLADEGECIRNSGPPMAFVESWHRFDARHYERIAKAGYHVAPHGSNTPFFPLYPLLSRWLGALVGDPVFAGIVISYLATYLSLFFVYATVARQIGTAAANWTPLLLLSFPGSAFLGMMYSEALFLLLVSGALYFYFQRRPWWAALFGYLAGLTRSAAVLYAAGMGVAALRAAWRERRIRWECVPAIAGILAGPLSYALWLQYRFGDFWAFGRYQRMNFDRKLSNPLAVLWESLRPAVRVAGQGGRIYSGHMQSFLDSFFAVAFVIVGVSAARRAPFEFPIIAVLTPLFGLMSGRTQGITRFCGVCFPGFAILGDRSARQPLFGQFAVYLFGALLAIVTTRYLLGGFCG